MKKSLSHLPENKQNEIRRIAEIIREVANPEMIILFGSYAKGTFVEHRYRSQDGTEYEYISDYDFLVVTKDEPEEPFRIESTIMDRVDRYRPPVNIEIHSINYINEGLGWGQYFFTDIVNEGVVIFNKETVQFATPRVLTADEEKQKAQEYFNIWFPQAEEFLIDSRNGFDRGSYKKALFELHQATECLYAAVLLVFTGYKPKLHNLWKLRKKAKPYSEELFGIFRAETDKNEERLFELLKQGYIEARYKTGFTVDMGDLALLIKRIESVVPIVRDICSKKIGL